MSQPESIDLTNEYSHLSICSDGSDEDEPMQTKIEKAMKRLTENQNMKFMENFDPQTSNRERRKLDRKTQPLDLDARRKAAVYDEKGIHKASGKDLCDCLDEACPGCHFPCPKCRSCKCGQECRQNRKYSYDCLDIEGTRQTIKNKYKTPHWS